MAKLYEHLYQSEDVSNIDAQGYLAEILQDGLHAAGASDGVNTKLECDGIWLDTKTATVLAQILRELVSNCVKHAFPNGQGTVDINLRKLDNSMLELTVVDDGVGLPKDFDEKNLKSMGIKLVNALVSQIGGKKTMTSGNGTTIQIVFPEGK